MPRVSYFYGGIKSKENLLTMLTSPGLAIAVNSLQVKVFWNYLGLGTKHFSKVTKHFSHFSAFVDFLWKSFMEKIILELNTFKKDLSTFKKELNTFSSSI